MDNVKNDAYYVKKMLKDISFILGNTKGITLQQLTNNEILCDSVLFRLIQISENSVKLTGILRRRTRTFLGKPSKVCVTESFTNTEK